jgi:hypothetical protein
MKPLARRLASYVGLATAVAVVMAAVATPSQRLALFLSWLFPLLVTIGVGALVSLWIARQPAQLPNPLKRWPERNPLRTALAAGLVTALALFVFGLGARADPIGIALCIGFGLIVGVLALRDSHGKRTEPPPASR